jgi:hypothetical protein
MVPPQDDEMPSTMQSTRSPQNYDFDRWLATLMDLRDRLTRVEEKSHHSSETTQLTVTRQHAQADHHRLLADRVAKLEQRDREHVKFATAAKPIMLQHRRKQDRRRFIKDLISWISGIGMVVWAIGGAIIGKIPWQDALSALLRMSGAGS